MMVALRAALRPSWRGNVLGTALATVTPATREALPSIWPRSSRAVGSVPAVAASGGSLGRKADASTSRLTTDFTARNPPRSPFYGCPCKDVGGGNGGSGENGGGDEGGDDDDDALRAELAALAAEAWEAIRKARDNEERFAILTDGTKLKVTDLTMGPCLSVVKDTKTGRVFYGQNTGEFPTNLSEPLKSNRDRLIEGRASPPGFRPGWTRARGYPGSHSEVQALDQGIKARPGAELQDFAVYNIRLKENSNGAAGTPMCRCDDCKIITDGVNALTD